MELTLGNVAVESTVWRIGIRRLCILKTENVNFWMKWPITFFLQNNRKYRQMEVFIFSE